MITVSLMQKLVPQFSPSVAMVDFEEASVSAFRRVFGNVYVTGCWFHVANAIIKRVHKLGLKDEYVIYFQTIYILSSSFMSLIFMSVNLMSVNLMSVNFMPGHLVRQFHVRHFQSTRRDNRRMLYTQ